MRSVTRSNIRICSILGIQNFIATYLPALNIVNGESHVYYISLAYWPWIIFAPHNDYYLLFIPMCGWKNVTGGYNTRVGIHSMIMINNYNYRNLPVNSRSLHSSHPQIIAAGCCANTVINAAFG